MFVYTEVPAMALLAIPAVLSKDYVVIAIWIASVLIIHSIIWATDEIIEAIDRNGGKNGNRQ